MGGAFALAGSGEIFYTNRRWINFLGLTYRTDIILGSYILFAQTTSAWNPAAELPFMEIALNLF